MNERKYYLIIEQVLLNGQGSNFYISPSLSFENVSSIKYFYYSIETISEEARPVKTIIHFEKLFDSYTEAIKFVKENKEWKE